MSGKLAEIIIRLNKIADIGMNVMKVKKYQHGFRNEKLCLINLLKFFWRCKQTQRQERSSSNCYTVDLFSMSDGIQRGLQSVSKKLSFMEKDSSSCEPPAH